MTLIGISVDDVAASRKLAAREGIDFALLSDTTLEVSRQYVGVDDNDLSVPGVVLVRQDGTIAYRRISADKADRPTTAELLAAIDDTLGPPAHAPGLRGGFAPIERLAIGVDVGVGAEDGDARVPAAAHAVYPLLRHVVVGAAVGGEPIGGRLDLDASAGARLPFYADLAAVTLSLRAGPTFGDHEGWHAGARLSLGFAATPAWRIAIGVGAVVLDVGDEHFVEPSITLDVSRMIRVR